MSSIPLALLESLLHSPLLVGDLPEAATFSRKGLVAPSEVPVLNLEQKLGHLYEDGLAILLESAPGYELLAQNLQIRTDAHNTVGELDFLVRDLESGQLIHLELATKFYLAVETEDRGLTLPGPDARDNYFKKLQRLREHQLVLAQKHRHLLPEQYRHEPAATRQLIYGCLFDHIQSREPAAPPFVHPGCRRGRWLTVDQCLEYFPEGTRFRIIPKHLWPVGLEFLHESTIRLDPWTPKSAVERCIMLRVNDECIPYFVTPSGYPEPGTAATQ